MMYYDRHVSKALIDALLSGGPFSFLARYAKTQPLADLQFRGYPNSNRYWATLYVGLTGILHIYEQNGQFWLKGNTKSEEEWSKSWAERRQSNGWRLAEEQLLKYLNLEMPRGLRPHFTKEGKIQAMLCAPSTGRFGIIDREVIIGFPKGREKDRIATNKRLLQPLRAACQRGLEGRWSSVPKEFGGELDLLAIDPDGRLLAIEVKSESNLVGITWAPLQAIFYAELLKAWSHEVGQESQRILHRMLRQRIKLGLTRSPNRALKYPLEIVPVVAFGGPPKSPQAIPRLKKVKKALLDANLGYKSIIVWQVEGSAIWEII
jgi:hypothetical protein